MLLANGEDEGDADGDATVMGKITHMLDPSTARLQHIPAGSSSTTSSWGLGTTIATAGRRRRRQPG